MDLKDLVVETKSVELDYPGLEGFKVTLKAISRPVSQKIEKASKRISFNKGSRLPVEERDDDLFVQAFAKHAIEGWTGLKYKYLEDLVLADVSAIEDLESELEYSPDNAVVMLKNSPEFNTWVNRVVFDLDSFRTAK